MRVSELKGGSLDFWVGKAEGRAPTIQHYKNHSRCFIETIDSKGKSEAYVYSPSTKWGQGGYLIQRHGINVTTAHLPGSERWYAYTLEEDVIEGEEETIMCNLQQGDTALEAAMRCYVALMVGEAFDGEFA